MAVPFTYELMNLTCSAGSGDLLYLFSTSIRVVKSQIRVTGGSLDTTGVTGSAQNMKSHIGALRSAEISFEGLWPKSSPQKGISSLITYNSVAQHRAKNLNINIEYGEVDITGFTGAADTWKSFMPGGIGKWGGSYTVLADSGAAATLPNAGASLAAVFKLLEDGTDPQLSGNVILEEMSLSPDIQATTNPAEIPYTFTGDGDLTQTVGSNPTTTSPGFTGGTGAIDKPDWDLTSSDGVADNTVVATLITGRTYTGPAFWKSLTIVSNPNEIIRVSGVLRVAGTLTLA